MRRFAFFVHALDMRDIYRSFPETETKRQILVEKMMQWMPPYEVAHIKGLQCADGEEAEGWFIGLALLPQQFMELPKETVFEKIMKGAEIAHEKGAKILGLGGFSSVVGNGGVTTARMVSEKFSDLPLTSGNSCTIAAAMEATALAASKLGIDMEQASAAVIGGSGSIGSVCARLLAAKVKKITLIARNQKRLESVAEEIGRETGAQVECCGTISEGIGDADIVITATSSSGNIVAARDLKSGALVCDVSLPHDVCREVAVLRPDVLVIEGGLMHMPAGMDLDYDFGFPRGIALACMAETMTLCMEGRFEEYSIGRGIQIDKVREIWDMAQRQGFRLAGFRSFERMVTDEMVEKVKSLKGMPLELPDGILKGDS